MEAGGLVGVAGVGEETARWKRFTPSSVDMSRCLARVWSGGRGGQCANAPLPGEDLCKRHAAKFGKDGCHGKVTGGIPEKKLKEFEKAAEKATARERLCEDGGPRKGSGEVRGEGRDAEQGMAEPGARSGNGLKRLRRAGFAAVGSVSQGLAGEVCGVAGNAAEEVNGATAAAAAGTGSAMACGERENGSEGGRVLVGGVVRGRGAGGRGRGRMAAARGSSGRGRVVMGFGNERVEDVRALEEDREQESCQRQRERNEQFARGRARDLQGDLDRADGGAFSWRR